MIHDSSGLLYENLASQIAGMIESGGYKSGDRLPSLRKTCLQHGVSTATAMQAYLTLENRGLVEARPKSGFFVRARWSDTAPEHRSSKPSSKVSTIKAKSLMGKVFQAAGKPDIIPFGAACPSSDVLPAEKLSLILRTVDRRHSKRSLNYDMPPGCEVLRRQVSIRSMDWGDNLQPDEIITTVGCMEALNLCIRAVAKPGDIIAIESPSYFGVIESIRELGMRVVEIPMHPRDGMDLDALEEALAKHKIAACLSVPNFNNPLGCCMPDANKKRLVELLAKRKIPLIEDDIYGDLHYGPTRPRTAKSFDQEGLVMLCSSFTKTLAPGYRVGWVAPGRFYERVLNLKFTNTVATPTLPQFAIAEFLKNGGYDRYLRGVRKFYAEQIQRFGEAVSVSFPAGTTLSRPAGGFVLWVGLPKGCDAVELHDAALERNIGITPGPLFSATHGYKNFIRLTCAQPWSKQIERALSVLGQLATRMAKP